MLVEIDALAVLPEVLRVTRHEHVASVIVSMSGTVIFCVAATAS
jgi:hypothetical protein